MERTRTIKVTGRGTVRLRPDMTCITMTLEGKYPEYSDALKHSSEDTETLKSALEGLGFDREELKTLQFSVDAEYEGYNDPQGNWRQRFAGYRFRHVFKFEFPSDNDLLGRTLYTLSRCGVDPEFRISYTIKDREAAKNELLGKAVADSRDKAEVIAAASGVNLGDILRIDYSLADASFEVVPMRNMAAKAMGMSRAEDSLTMDINPDDIEVSDTVTTVWEIK